MKREIVRERERERGEDGKLFLHAFTPDANNYFPPLLLSPPPPPGKMAVSKLINDRLIAGCDNYIRPRRLNSLKGIYIR